MNDFYLEIVAIFVMVLLFTIDRTLKYYKQKELFDLVAWSAMGYYDSYSNCYHRSRDLVNYIVWVQKDVLISAQYRITEDKELKLVNEIIKAYQEHILKLYFRNQLCLIKSKRVVLNTTYFMAQFLDFLSKNCNEHEFLGHNMYSKVVDFKSYDGDGYRVKYAMSDFGIVFYKLYYISYMYCKKSLVLKNTVSAWVEKNIKDVLDTKQNDVSCFRH